MKVKKIISLTVLLFFTASGWAKTLNVVTTTPDLADLVRQVGGGLVHVESLASPMQNPHFVDAKPSLIVKVMKSDLFVLTGMDLEIGWAPLLLTSSGNRKVQQGAEGFLDCSVAISPLEVPVKADRSMGDVHPMGNPHYMLDPGNAGLAAKLIVEKLSTMSPENADQFKKNLAVFEERLGTALKRWKSDLLPFQGKKFVSYHKVYPYFATSFGLTASGEIEPKPGIPPTAVHTADLIEIMKKNQVLLILTEPWHEGRTSESLARQTGAKVVVMCLFPGTVPEAKDYFSMMDYNVHKIAEALSGK